MTKHTQEQSPTSEDNESSEYNSEFDGDDFSDNSTTAFSILLSVTYQMKFNIKILIKKLGQVSSTNSKRPTLTFRLVLVTGL
jgi:hypothetical protein